MIRCLLIRISRNQRGQVMRTERLLEGDGISIGRSAECKIHLQDHRISLHHATIHCYDDGKAFMVGVSAPISTGDAYEQSIELTQGTHIRVGPYEFVVEDASNGKELTLSYELVHPLADPNATSTSQAPVTLAGTGLSKRIISFWLASFIAITFLILPITYALNPAWHKILDKLPVTPDESWNVGNMSPGHRALSTKCNTCHQKPFQAVTNQACAHCHKSVDKHIADQALDSKVFKGMRCSQCHIDHRGLKGLVRHDSQQCVACHGHISAIHQKTTLKNIHDFSVDHPAFRLTIRTELGEGGIQRIRQSDNIHLIEKSGLKFSHEIHLDKALIELPLGKTRDIQCNDCHHADTAGIGFEPMTMEASCQQSKCHALNFNPLVENRKVPHATEQTVITTLREFYASRAINNIPENVVIFDDLRRVRKQAYTDAHRNAKALFEETGEGTCLECHEITNTPNNKEVPWKVEPVRVADRWLPKGNFPHAKHQTSKCIDCHKAAHSDKSSDVLIPTIKKCSECHAGNQQEKTRLSSTCNTCHNFHNSHSQQQVHKSTIE